MGDRTLYDTTAPSQGSLALAHQRLLRQKVNGVFVNITGDINALALNPSPISVQREVYGTKGKTSTNIIGYNFAPTFNVEVVRDPATDLIVGAQAWLLDLIDAAYSTGGANKREFQIITDAFDERFPAFEGLFSVSVADANNGYADKALLTFTLNNDGDTEKLAVSPIAGDGKPILETASPAGAAVGDLIAVRGYGLASFVSATIDGAAVVESRVVDDNTVVLQIPATVAGSAPIVITNAQGASTALPYTAA